MKNNIEIDWKALSMAAWTVRDRAFILGKTKVGAALLSVDNKIYTGCNVEQRYRNHDVHAEVNAITNMISAGQITLKAILIAAERDNFTPCGSCLDWIFQFGGPECYVAFQALPESNIKIFQAKVLMPYYPS